MAVSTPRMSACPFFNRLRIVRSVCCMALQAEKWLFYNQEVVIDRAMRFMTAVALLSIISMFKDKRALFFSMAPGACFFNSIFDKEIFIYASMLLMTVRAKYPLFRYWMVAGQ